MINIKLDIYFGLIYILESMSYVCRLFDACIYITETLRITKK